MKKTLTLALTLGLAACGKSDAPTSTGAAPAPAAQSAAKKFSGGISGRITFTGKVPAKGRKVKMNADPKCAAQYTSGFRYKPLVVSGDGGLADAFVYVKKGLEGKKFPVPARSKAILDQKGCWYYPRVSGIMVGQKLTILNSDPTMHNVNASPNFNAAMPPTVKKLEKKFKKAKVMFKLKCNVHPWMRAYVGILTHPFYAVTDENGDYKIAGLPPGKYEFGIWHEKLGTLRKEAEVGTSVVNLNLEFAVKKKG